MKTVVFAASSSLPPLVDGGGKLDWAADEKATSPILCSVAFRSNIIRRLLRDMDPCGGNDSDGMFSLFYRQVARELTPKLAVIFRHLVRGGKFPACRRLVDVVPVPKESAIPRMLEITFIRRYL